MLDSHRYTRRRFLHEVTIAGGAAAAAGLLPSLAVAAKKGGPKGLRIGSCMLDLPAAKEVGLDGIEARTSIVGDNLDLVDPAVRERYKEQMKATGLPIASLMLGFFNSYPLASDPRGPKWIEQAIEAGKDLGARVLLVAFFGKGDLRDSEKRLKKSDVDVVVKHLQSLAPKAEQCGVILAVENWLSAEQNMELLDRVGSKAVQLYYDVGNSTVQGYDVPSEIRRLKERIVSIHFKDNGHYLGEGKVRFAPIAEAIEDIGYRGWIIMETANPSGKPVDDSRRNAAYIRKLFGMS